MPCRYDPTPEEIRASKEKREQLYKEKLDTLTHERDVAYEHILRFSLDPQNYEIDREYLNKISVSQVAHRKEDLARLEEVFRSTKDYYNLGRVVAADPTKPLEEQLGFDPDKF